MLCVQSAPFRWMDGGERGSADDGSKIDRNSLKGSVLRGQRDSCNGEK